MKRLTPQELQLLQRVSAAGGSHCFRQEDTIPAPAIKMLKSLERRGYLTAEQTDDGPLVTLTAQGMEEAGNGSL